MKLLLKLLAVPVALALTLATAICSFVLSASGIVFGIASNIGFLLSVALLVTGQTTGGIAFMVIAFLISPFGLTALGGALVRALDGAGGMLKAFIFS